MAALTSSGHVSVRAALPGEGHAVADLWRELWDAHEAWGGYEGTRDPRVYEQLAVRLSEDARVRSGQPVLGRHVHLVAETDDGIVGQVEGWFERFGIDEQTPYTCEVRSLIVSSRSRARGIGRVLLERLAAVAKTMSRGLPVVMAAEVLEPNPAHAFYARVGYVPVSWNARVRTDAAPRGTSPFVARRAMPADALGMCMLDPALASRRRLHGDLRFDRPRVVDATLVGALASHLARPFASSDASELVVVDGQRVVHATASLAVMSLDPPFVPARRGLIGRFALDPALDPGPLVGPLVELGKAIARTRQAATLELTDLDAPGEPLHEAVLAAGAEPWSRIVQRFA